MVNNRRYQRRKKRNASLKWLLIGGLFFCLFGGLAYFLIWSPYFWLSQIEFKPDEISRYYRQGDVEKIIQSDLDEKFWRLVPQRSVFLFSAPSAQNEILDKYPEIKSVQISKKFPNAIELAIEERKGVGVWCQLEPSAEEAIKEGTTSTSSASVLPERKIGQCFSIDQEGVIYRESALVEGGFVLNIFSGRNSGAGIRDRVASQETMDFILKLKDDLPQIKTAGQTALSAANFEIVSTEDLKVKTGAGFEIFFNPGYSAETQLTALQMVLDDEIKGNCVFLKYIDLRIEGRAYYLTR